LIAPVIWNLTNISTTNESSYINWSCDEACNYSISWYNSTDELVDTISLSTYALSHSAFLGNLSNSSIYRINLTVWDASGNYARNDTFNFTTAKNIYVDNINPGYSNFVNNASNTKILGSVNFSITLTDNDNLSYAIFMHNQSGVFQNVSGYTLAGTVVEIYYVINVSIGRGNVICGRYWVNDTSGNENITNESCFTVANTLPTHNNPVLFAAGNDTEDVLYCYNQSLTDADNDSITALYKWYINGSFVFSSSTYSVLPNITSVGDNFSCEIEPSDPYGTGATKSSNTVAILPSFNRIWVSSQAVDTGTTVTFYANCTELPIIENVTMWIFSYFDGGATFNQTVAATLSSGIYSYAKSLTPAGKWGLRGTWCNTTYYDIYNSTIINITVSDPVIVDDPDGGGGGGGTIIPPDPEPEPGPEPEPEPDPEPEPEPEPEPDPDIPPEEVIDAIEDAIDTGGSSGGDGGGYQINPCLYLNLSKLEAAKRTDLIEHCNLSQEATEINRTIIVDYERNVTIVNLTITPNGTIYNFTYYEQIPKCLVELIKRGYVNESIIKFYDENFTIVEEDPLIMWQFPVLDKKINLGYEIKKAVLEDCLKLLRGLSFAEAIEAEFEKPSEVGTNWLIDFISMISIWFLIIILIVFTHIRKIKFIKPKDNNQRWEEYED
jgi:hypothetical protein